VDLNAEELNLGPTHGSQSYAPTSIAFAFAGSDSIVLARIVPGPQQLNAGGNSDAPISSSLGIMVLDAKTGKKISRYRWPAPTRPLAVYAARERIIVRADAKIYDLSLDSQEQISERQVSGSDVRVSASGKTLLACPIGDEDKPIQILEAESLRLLDSFREDSPCSSRKVRYDVSETFVLAQKKSSYDLLVRPLGEDWRPLNVAPLLSHPALPRNAVQFINDRNLVEWKGPNFQVFTVEGDVLFKQKLADGNIWGPKVTTAGGSYFALVQEKFRGVTIDALDMYGYPTPDYLVVFSLDDKREVFRVRVAGVSPWTHRTLFQDYALAPDGSEVAVLTDGVVRAYAVK
jgi:hypothetical protein